MTQEELYNLKNLLLKDLCARVPYGVKVQYMNNIFVIDYVSSYEEVKLDIPDNWTVGVSEVKPYLFPLSSMTDEQKSELNKKFTVQFSGNDIYSIHYHSEGYWDTTDLELDFQDWLWFINWCYKNHFDIYGLIPMGLALDATGLNIY